MRHRRAGRSVPVRYSADDTRTVPGRRAGGPILVGRGACRRWRGPPDATGGRPPPPARSAPYSRVVVNRRRGPRFPAHCRGRLGGGRGRCAVGPSGSTGQLSGGPADRNHRDSAPTRPARQDRRVAASWARAVLLVPCPGLSSARTTFPLSAASVLIPSARRSRLEIEGVIAVISGARAWTTARISTRSHRRSDHQASTCRPTCPVAHTLTTHQHDDSPISSDTADRAQPAHR